MVFLQMLDLSICYIREKMTTIKDVAREADVSIGTVSATLNGTKYVSEKLQKRVHEAVRKVGYTPSIAAQSLKKGSAKIIGLILPDITNQFFAVLARAVEKEATSKGYTVLLGNSDQDQKKEAAFLRLLKNHRVAGLVLAPSCSGEEYGRNLTETVTTPVVMVDRKTEGVSWDFVVSGNKDGARRAVMHLIECGHSRIAAIFGIPHVSTVMDRLAGYKEAMSGAGYLVSPEITATGCTDAEKVRMAAQAMLNLRERPTAFFAANNQVLQGIMHAIRNHGLDCPRDISITGFDGMGLADLMDPPMTTVEQAASEMGAKAVKLLIRRLQGDSGPPQHIVLPTQFLVRSSTIPPQESIYKW